MIEHEHEPVRGLPERLPAGERMLWQGAPNWRRIATHTLHIRAVAGYFVGVALLQAASELANGGGPAAATGAAFGALVAGAMGCAVLAVLAVAIARTTVYTVTDRRVVMRIGVALTKALNIPYGSIASAGLRTYGDGTGDIPLQLAPPASIGYTTLWPHARPMRFSHAEPMLRGVPDAAAVARLVADGLTARHGANAAAPLDRTATPSPIAEAPQGGAPAPA
jgi:hypothetical protein